jgi:hypothetical protein
MLLDQFFGSIGRTNVDAGGGIRLLGLSHVSNREPPFLVYCPCNSHKYVILSFPRTRESSA